MHVESVTEQVEDVTQRSETQQGVWTPGWVRRRLLSLRSEPKVWYRWLYLHRAE